MRMIKRLSAILLLLSLLLPLAPRAAADGDARFDGKSWEQIVGEFLDSHNANPNKVACGWMNTVTGETQFYNGDNYMVSGSMYKIPMNMLFTERIHNGELDWESWVGGYHYEYALKATVVESNNDVARSMWDYLGGYQTYRRLIAPYMGEDPDTVDEKFYENNFFTPRQMIYCLNLLCTESERFPRLIDTLLQAEPEKYFKLHAHDCDIAHKYGYFVDGNHFYLNDCAICYTTEPVCIVLFTDTVAEPYALLADFCDLMVDYSEYSTAARRAEEQRLAEEAAIAALQSPAPMLESPVPSPTGGEIEPALTPAPAAEDEPPVLGGLVGPIVLAIAVAIAALILLTGAAAKARDGKIKLPWAVAAVLLGAAALMLCAFPSRSSSPSAAAPGRDLARAGESADAFFAALCDGDYDAAYSRLYGYSTLGLESTPADEDAAAIWQAVRESWSYKLYGDSVDTAAGARQQVLFTCLDARAFSDAVKSLTEERVEYLASALPQEEVYAEDGGYLESFTSRAYGEALERALSRAGEFYTVTGINVELQYVSGKWLIVPDNALISALSGGALG